ncbi:MAG: DUF29 domain-containing protein [Bryobacterales bacterium]|nr:DUF29 domain-containing protein [Bryobacterales bacterium]
MEKQLRNIEDAYKWSLETAAALRAGDFSRINTEELIDEIESIASGLWRELESILKDILEGMLMKEYGYGDPQEADRQLVTAQGELQLLLYSSPSLRDALGEAIAQAYQRARRDVTEDYGAALPDECPFAVERIVEDPYDRLVAEGKLV